jgi:hypothetical protein
MPDEMQSLSASLDELGQVLKLWTTMNIPSEVKIKLKHRAQYGWVIDLVVKPGNDYQPHLLDERAEWCYQQLKDWPMCQRTAWDMWSFQSKHDAEKFITLYTVQWAQ